MQAQLDEPRCEGGDLVVEFAPGQAARWGAGERLLVGGIDDGQTVGIASDRLAIEVIHGLAENHPFAT